MRFAFVQEHSSNISVERLCRFMNVTSRDFRAWRSRPISQGQRLLSDASIACQAVDDMVSEVVLHIRPFSSQFKMDHGFNQAANLIGSDFLS